MHWFGLRAPIAWRQNNARVTADWIPNGRDRPGHLDVANDFASKYFN